MRTIGYRERGYEAHRVQGQGVWKFIRSNTTDHGGHSHLVLEVILSSSIVLFFPHLKSTLTVTMEMFV